MRRLRRRLDAEEGVSLLELVIVMALLTVIGSLLATSLSSSSEAAAHIDDQDRGLADLRVVTERMSRDLRAARAVDTGATESQLTLWIDDNSDYRRQPDESVTWRIPDGGPDVRQYDVERIVGDPATSTAIQVVGKSLVSRIAFSYYADQAMVTPSAARSVRVSMLYDAIVDAYATPKQVDFEVRLRNVQ